MTKIGIRHWFARVLGDCLKRRRNDPAYVDSCVGEVDKSEKVVTSVPSFDVLPDRLQLCTSNDELIIQEDPRLWTETNRLVNAAAAWQIRRVMPIDVATLSEVELEKMTTPELARRYKNVPILLILRANNDTLRHLSLQLLSKESFQQLTLLERRAIHNVLAERPIGWNQAQLMEYAAREREMIAAANEEARDIDKTRGWSYEVFYMVKTPRTFPTYAQEPRHWDEQRDKAI